MFGSTNTIIRYAVLVAAVCILSAESASAQVSWDNDVRVALSKAKKSGRPLLIQFTAEWCHFCHKMKATTFADGTVKRKINDQFIPVMLDADQHAELVSRLNLKGLPATVVVDPNLRILKKLNGYQDVDKLNAELDSVIVARKKVASVGFTRPSRPSTRNVTKGPLPTVRPGVAQVKSPEPPSPKAEPIKALPVAFDGLCLVALRDERALQKGTRKFSLKYKGQVVSFASQESLVAFRENPTRYWPKHNGACQVAGSTGKPLAGKPEFGVMFRNNVWLFSSAENMNRFVADPGKYAK
jgi:thioredoxin-related protein/YHS domain-containing protein